MTNTGKRKCPICGKLKRLPHYWYCPECQPVITRERKNSYARQVRARANPPRTCVDCGVSIAGAGARAYLCPADAKARQRLRRARWARERRRSDQVWQARENARKRAYHAAKFKPLAIRTTPCLLCGQIVITTGVGGLKRYCAEPCRREELNMQKSVKAAEARRNRAYRLEKGVTA